MFLWPGGVLILHGQLRLSNLWYKKKFQEAHVYSFGSWFCINPLHCVFSSNIVNLRGSNISSVCLHYCLPLNWLAYKTSKKKKSFFSNNSFQWLLRNLLCKVWDSKGIFSFLFFCALKKKKKKDYCSAVNAVLYSFWRVKSHLLMKFILLHCCGTIVDPWIGRWVRYSI